MLDVGLTFDNALINLGLVTVNQDGFQKVSDELFVGGRLVEIEKIKLTKEVPGSHKNTT